MVTSDLGLLPELVHLAVQGGLDPAVGSGQGQQPAQLTGSGLNPEFNRNARTCFDDMPLHTLCAWAEDTQKISSGREFP